MFDLTTIKNIVNQQYQKTQIEWHIFNIIDSTQKFLQNHLPTHHNNLQICIAKQQTASIGQKNKSWVSPNNTGLWFSIAMNNNCKVPWSLAVAKDIAQIITSYNIKPQLKWPNDILINNKKCTGILTELTNRAGSNRIIIGIGINLLDHKILPENATAINKHAENLIIDEFIVATINSVIKRLLHPETAWLQFWQQHLYFINKQVTITQGKSTSSGILTGISSNGALIINNKHTHYDGKLTLNI